MCAPDCPPCVLCFEQVATKTQIRAEDYLRMTFEHDAEFVHGEIVERSMPDWTHSRIQTELAICFGSLRKSHGLYTSTELRMKVAPDVYRIPDVAVYVGRCSQPVPETPPLVAIEISSKDDRYSDLMQKLEEYRQWGVQHIWLIDPATKRFSIYTDLGLQNASSLDLPGYPFQLTPAELFNDL